MSRKIISLNGIWELSLDKRFEPINTYSISVPSCIGNEVPALRDYRGVLWYRKYFNIDRSSEKDSFIIFFSAVNYYSEVWINNNLIGSHEGGYTSFSFDVSRYIKSKNELVVKVLLPGNNDPNYPLSEIPHGKQESQWYGIAGGIWQDVVLIQTGNPYISKVFITPDLDKNLLSIKIKSEGNNKETSNYKLLISIIDPFGKEIIKSDINLKPLVELQYSISNPILWDIESPYLYTLKATIFKDKNKIIDETTETFGIRKIETKNGEILLNGKPIYIIGALDQDFYPFTHYTPPNEDFVKDELILAKEMGLNCLRYHLKVPHPWYLKWADRLGLLIWEDLPNWSKSTPASKARGRKTLEEMIEHDYNHPSVIIRTIINEGWGLDLINNDGDREWLRTNYEWLKKEDPTRLVVDNSACFPNFHIKTDIEDFHNYFAFPDRFNEMKEWTSVFASRPNWTFGPNAERKNTEPLIVSEFGNWGLPNIDKLRGQYGGNPWWFLQGDPNKATRPLEAEERFWEFGLNRVFESVENLSKAFQNLQAQALRFQIEEIRKYLEIKGYIITEFTDVYWECNGLLDITRGKKVFFDELKDINSLDLVFPKERPTGVWSGENISLPIFFSHLSEKNIESVKLFWSLDEGNIKGYREIERIKRGLNELGNIDFTVPEVVEPKTFRLYIKLSAKNKIINENYIDLFVVPKNLLKLVNLRLGTTDNSLRDLLNPIDLQFSVINSADIVYSLEYNEILRSLVEDGKTVILELSEDTYFSQFGYKLELRRGVKEGRWISGLGILHPKIAGRVFKEKILDYRFINDSPTCYLNGEFNFNSKTLAGMVFGWIDQPINFMVEIPVGKGRFIIHTFPIIKRLSNSPVMVALLYQILKNCIRR